MKQKQSKSNLKFLLLASYMNNLGWGIYAPLYAVFVLGLGGSSFDISFLWGVYAMVAGMLMMLFGKLENKPRYRPEYMLVVGYGLFIIVAIGFLNIRTIHQFYAVQMLLAVAMGILTPAARLTYMRAERKGNEAGQWGLFDGGNYMLIAIASFAGGFLYKAGGFQALFISMLVIQIVATYLALQNLIISKSSKSHGALRKRQSRTVLRPFHQ